MRMTNDGENGNGSKLVNIDNLTECEAGRMSVAAKHACKVDLNNNKAFNCNKSR